MLNIIALYVRNVLSPKFYFNDGLLHPFIKDARHEKVFKNTVHDFKFISQLSTTEGQNQLVEQYNTFNFLVRPNCTKKKL